MEDKIGWIRFLKGKLAREEEAKFYQMLPEIEEGEKVYAAIMKIDTDTIENTGGMMNILAELQKLGQKLNLFIWRRTPCFCLCICHRRHRIRKYWIVMGMFRIIWRAALEL